MEPIASIGHLSEAKRRLLDVLLSHEKPVRRGISGAIPRRTDPVPVPPSLMQEQLWLLETSSPTIPPLYNESITLKMKGALSVAVLERSLAEIIRRHEIWRTTYHTLDGRAVQHVHPAADRFPLTFEDLCDLPPGEREARVLELGKEQAGRHFDLEGGPLLRATLAGVGEAENWLIMTAHQSIVDGVSVYQVFPSELCAIYGAFLASRPSPLPELPLQFSDFAYWQREMLTPEKRDSQLGYWRKKLSGDMPGLRWPDTKPRPPKQTFRGHIRSFPFLAKMAADVRGLARRAGSTEFLVLLAALYGLLHHYTGQSSLTVGTFSPAGRKRSEAQNLLGYFLNPVPLRIDVGDDPSFFEIIRRAQETVSEAISHDDVPFEHVVEALKPPIDPSRNPYFSVAASLQPQMPELQVNWSITSMDAESGGSRWDLYVAFIDRPEGLNARVQYNPDIFAFNEIRQMTDDFRALLERVALHPERRVSELWDRKI